VAYFLDHPVKVVYRGLPLVQQITNIRECVTHEVQWRHWTKHETTPLCWRYTQCEQRIG